MCPRDGRRLVGAVLALAGGLCASQAHAHPVLDDARRLLEAADFEGALESVSRAEASPSLSRGDLVDALELRVLVHYALGRSPDLEMAAAELASLEPDHRFPAGTNPDVVTRFARVRTTVRPLQLDVDARPDGTALEIRGRTRGGAPGLVRGLVISVRRDDGPWQSQAADRVRVPLLAVGGRPTSVAYRGEARGAGNATLVSTPTQLWAQPAVPLESAPTPAPRWYWWAGAAVVVGGVLTAVFLSVGDETRTRPGAPQVTWR